MTRNFHHNYFCFYTFLALHLFFLQFIISSDLGDTVQSEETRDACGPDTEGFKAPHWCITINLLLLQELANPAYKLILNISL